MNDDDIDPDESQESNSKESHSEELEKQEHPQQKPKEMQMHDFNFVCYEDKITILGASGSGKSYLANFILQNLHGITVFVWDMNYQFHDSRSILFHNLDDMIEASNEAGAHAIHCILQSHDNSEAEFRRFCKFCFNHGNAVIICDELHSYLSKQKVCKEFNDLILSGRPRGVSVISISSRPASLPNNVLSNSMHVFSFKLNLASDAEFLETFVGEEVWQLMPIDKRKKQKDQPELEKHTYYYRNQNEDSGIMGRV